MPTLVILFCQIEIILKDSTAFAFVVQGCRVFNQVILPT